MSTHQAWATPSTLYRRNVHFFDGNGAYLGGLYVNNPPRITNYIIQTYCERFINFAPNQEWRLYSLNANNLPINEIPANNRPMQRGRYVILSPQRQGITLTLRADVVNRRVPSHQPSTSSMRGNQRHFRDRVFDRDRRCVITGDRAPRDFPREGLVAAHIYPLSQQREWASQGRASWITDRSSPTDIQPNGLFSAQNGLLLTSTIHPGFDRFHWGIDPDNGHRVITFTEDTRNLRGRYLNTSTRRGPTNHRVSDQCLRWHLEQCILSHMRGAGERAWDLEDDDYEDVRAIMDHEDAADLMETQLATRLGAYLDVEAN